MAYKLLFGHKSDNGRHPEKKQAFMSNVNRLLFDQNSTMVVTLQNHCGIRNCRSCINTVHLEKIQAAKTMYHRSPDSHIYGGHMLKEGAKSGRTVISIPEIPSPAPHHRTNLIFTGHEKKEPPNCMGLNVVETNQPITVLQAVHARVSLEAGQGWAAVPPPYASLTVYTS
jgi:hypothetical protein